MIYTNKATNMSLSTSFVPVSYPLIVSIALCRPTVSMSPYSSKASHIAEGDQIAIRPPLCE